jgi:hypothetical protein
MRFKSEADMLSPLVRNVRNFTNHLSGTFRTFFEVQSSTGIPDVVLISFNEQRLFERALHGLAPIVETADVAVMTALAKHYGNSHGAEFWSASELSHVTGLTPGYLSSTVLRRLQKDGYIEKVSHGKWTPIHSFRPLADHVICIETKRTDWRAGFWQANRQESDYTWLVLDAAASSRNAARAEKFAARKVGLATLSASSELDILIPALARRPSTVQRNVLIERTADLYLQGKVSGPVSHVFGRDLHATTGADPRLEGAGAR